MHVGLHMKLMELWTFPDCSSCGRDDVSATDCAVSHILQLPNLLLHTVKMI